jgi:hypothetical protein
MSRFEFSTTDYEWAHGREPRGRGSWAFSLERNPDVSADTVLWSPSMTFTDAKRWFAAEAGRRGLPAGRVYVLT